ncbi:MAG TPA: hypothetical protein VEC93_08910, partial [Anaerolineae bacterium]|nr:hypothetical protein [Anaerolineae bacterium]
MAEGELPVTRLFQNASNEAGTAAPERKVPVDKTPARKLAGAKKYVEPGSDSSTVKNVPRTEDSAAPSEKLPPRRVERVPPKGTRARQDYDTRMGRDPWLLKKGVMGEGVSVDDVKSAIEKEAPGLAGHVTVVKTADDLPKAHIEFFKKNGENLSKIDGYYTKGKGGAIGKAYVIAGNADSIDSAIRAVLHEVAGHKALHLFLGKEGERIMRMAYGSRDLSELRKSVEKKYVLEKDAAKKTGDMRQYEALIGEEMLAELAELDVKKMSPEKRSIFSRAISRIRSLIGKHFGINNYTRDDAIKLLKDAREFLESSKTDSKNDVGVGAVLSKKDQTKTPAFKKWFGDSKVVDADGKPLVVYHGTASDFTIFDRSMLGSSTGDAASYEGFFFSKEADTARLYAQEASYQRDRKKYDDGSRGVIYPVFLSIKNPLMVSYGESVNPETIQSAKSGGYDGVIDDRGDFVVFDPAQIKSAIGNRGTFDPDNPNIMLSKKSDTPDMFGGGDGGMDDMFGGQEDVIQPEKKKVYTGPRGTKEEQPDMFDAKLSRQAAKEAIDSALPSLSKEKLDKLSKRIGSGYRRWLTKEAGLPDDFFQAKVEGEGKRSMLVDVEAKYQAAIFKNAVQKAYGVPYRKLSDQQKHELNKALQGEKAKIPASAEALVGAMRDSLDAMSDDLVRVQKDMVLVALEAATPAQKSAYMQWLKDGADPEDTRGVPADLVKQTLMAKKIASNKGAYVNRSYQAFDDAEWMDKVMDDKRVIDNAARLLGSEGDPDPMATIKHILSEAKGKASPFDFIASEGKKMGIFKRRKDIPVEIRELLGEYKEPLLNYERSLSKMANIISNHHALMGMREAGLDSGLLSKKPTKDKYVEIKGGQSLTPLSGLYTTPEIAQAIEDYTKPEVFSGWLRALGWFNSTIKVGKTVYSDITQARNLLSNVALAISNGHINPEHLKESIKIAVVGAYDPSKMDRALIGMLTERGLINNSAINKELQEQVKEALGGKEPSGPAMLLKVISDIAQVTYGLSD